MSLSVETFVKTHGNRQGREATTHLPDARHSKQRSGGQFICRLSLLPRVKVSYVQLFYRVSAKSSNFNTLDLAKMDRVDSK